MFQDLEAWHFLHPSTPSSQIIQITGTVFLGLRAKKTRLSHTYIIAWLILQTVIFMATRFSLSLSLFSLSRTVPQVNGRVQVR